MLLVVLPMPGLKRLVPPNRSKNERSVMEQLERYRSVTYRGEFERLAKSKLREPPGLPPLHTSASTPVWEELILTPHPLFLLDAWGNLLRKVCMPAKMSRVSACSAPTDFSFVCEDFGEENCRLWRKMQQLFSPQAPPFPSSPLSLPLLSLVRNLKQN